VVKPALTLHLPGGVPMTFQRVPDVGEPQPFLMGERGLGGYIEGFTDPVVEVRPVQALYLGTYPVTQAQFGVWAEADKEKIQHEYYFKGRPEHPAEMDWRRANGYCDWLTDVCREQMAAGWRVCLPTEAEWEYACRAGSETEYYTGDGEAALAEAGWYNGNAENSTQPVGSKAPNAYGLYDLHGNVWEWCHDAQKVDDYRKRVAGDVDHWGELRRRDWQAGLARLIEPEGCRVLRGGSWWSSARNCRSTFRKGGRPDRRDWDYGFRVCLVPGPCPARSGAPMDSAAPGDGRRWTSPESDGLGVEQ
jgi:formylglycine-generating enzyme required for sulfatase activity